MEKDLLALNEAVKKESESIHRVFNEISKVIVGQKEMIESILMGLLTGGHVLLEGLPGLAKTLTISSLAQSVDLSFQRVQFTPDLLPTDLIGTMIFNPKTGEFNPKKGPIFTNILLADEINRAPAKVQSALLEAMAEKQVTIGETSYILEKPFLVLATQNPIEQEGTYPLPEAQMDRFMFKVTVDYPNQEEELKILERMSSAQDIPSVQTTFHKEDLERATQQVDSIYIEPKLQNYIVALVMASRHPQEYGLRRWERFIQVGGSPRSTLSFARASRAHAFLQGRGFVTVEDIKSVAQRVLGHRILLNYEAEAEEIKGQDIINEIIKQVEVS